MASRQRRSRARKSEANISSTSSFIGKKTTFTSRRTLLFTLLAITTAIFFSFQLSRYRNERSVTGRFISSILNSGSISMTKRPAVSSQDQEDDFKNRIAAITKQFQRELGAVGRHEEGGIALVDGESLVDHAITTKTLPEKSAEEEADDQKIGLEDLDQETLKAMLDALYARD